MRLSGVALGLALAVGLVGCPDTERHPLARIALSPEAIPEGDAWATPVTFDGRGSGDPFERPGERLTYAWSADDPTARFDGPSNAPTAVVRFSGQRPPEVTLTVRTVDGREATTTARVSLTVR